MIYLEEELYRNDTPGLSYSEMVHLLRSPAHYMEYKENPPETTPAMRFGSAVHAAILEPQKYADNYVVFDDSEKIAEIGGTKPRATNAYKEYKAQFELDNQGKGVLTVDDSKAITAMAEAVARHRSASALLAAEGAVEPSFIWEDEVTGTPLKARLDKLLKSGRVIDIKTCEDARPDAVMRNIWNFRYDVQAAMYREAVRATQGIDDMLPHTLIFVEKSAPHAVAVYELDDLTHEVGEMMRRQAIDTYAECVASGVWGAYSDDIQPISLPAWAGRDL